MSQPTGYPAPIDALLAVATCLGDFTIMNADGDTELSPRFFLGDEGVGGVIDCCSGDGQPILRIESGGEQPANGAPFSFGKHGCIGMTMQVKVTFLTCFKTISKSGTVITDPAELSYTRVIQASRWAAIEALRCCRPASIRFVSSMPMNTDGKCSGWQLDLQADLSMCGECPPSNPS